MSHIAKLLDCIDILQRDIFQFEMQSVLKSFENLVGILLNVIEKLDVATVVKINAILESMNMALISKDYLLLADLLEYELKPLLLDELRVTE